MDFIQIMLLIAAVIGIFLMVITLIRFNKDDNKNDESDSYLEIENSIKAINASREEAENTVDELNKFAESVLSDIDAKHQELLFIYNLIEEKKNEVARLYGDYNLSVTDADSRSAVDFTGKVDRTNKTINQISGNAGRLSKDSNKISNSQKVKKDAVKVSLNPKHNEILELHEKGMSVSEISKNLDMGQGEVKLILELSRTK